MHRLIFLVLLGFVTIPFRCQDTQYDDDKNKDYCMNATAPASMLDIPDSGWVKELLKERIEPKINAYTLNDIDPNTNPYYPVVGKFQRAKYSTMAGCASICFVLEPIIGQSMCKLDDYGRPEEVPRCQEERRRSKRRKGKLFRYTYESANGTLIEQIGNKAAENSTFWKCKGE